MEYNNTTNCSGMMVNGTCPDPGIDATRLLVIPIFIISLIGNTATIAIISCFKQPRVTDVLVLGLAITDLLATLIPLPMTIYAYLSLTDFLEGSAACNTYGTIAQFTRYSSALITTVIAIERYIAVLHPIVYRNKVKPPLFAGVLLGCWGIAFILAFPPAVDPNTPISSHQGFCLFNFLTPYAVFIVVYGLVQFVAVLVCFIVTTVALIRLLLRYRHVRTANNQVSRQRRDSTSALRQPGRSRSLVKKFSQMKLTAQEGLQLGIEAKFMIMFATVVILFYISWLPIVVMIIYVQAVGHDNIEDALFWGIRLTILSLGINPFLYGLLSGPYRQSYVYILRLVFSRCCKCIDPPSRTGYARALWISKLNQQPNLDLSYSYGSKHIPNNSRSELDTSSGALASPRKLKMRASEPILSTYKKSYSNEQINYLPTVAEHPEERKTVTINIEPTNMEDGQRPLLSSNNNNNSVSLLKVKCPPVYPTSPSNCDLHTYSEPEPSKKRSISLPDYPFDDDSVTHPDINTNHSLII